MRKLTLTRKSAATAGVAAVIAAGGLVAASAISADGDPIVLEPGTYVVPSPATITATTVVTETQPPVTETVTVTETTVPPPTTTAPPPTTTAEPPPAEPAAYYLSPTGSDANACTKAEPCRNLQRGYQRANLGDTVELATGSYGAQTVAASASKGQPDADLADVTFRPAEGAAVKFAEVRFYAPHIRLEGVEVNGMLTARYRPEQPSFQASGDVHFDRVRVVNGGRVTFSAVKNFSLTNSLIADNWRDGVDIYGSDSGAGDVGHYPENGLIENNEIRDLRLIDNDHIDGIQFTTGVNVVIRNNRIGPRIHHQGLLAKTDKGPVTGITIEENEFFDVIDPGFSLMVMRFNGRPCHTIKINDNVFHRQPTPRSGPDDQCTGEMVGNTMSSMSPNNCSQWLESFTLRDNQYLSGEPCNS